MSSKKEPQHTLKAEMTKDMITPHAGLALLGEFAVGLGSLQSTDRYLPKPGSGDGHSLSEYTFPLILILNGGWTLENTLNESLQQKAVSEKRDCIYNSENTSRETITDN